MTDHIAESAALYALGALDESEQARVDAHVGECDTCMRLLAQAESDVATLSQSQTQHVAPASLDARVRRLLLPTPRRKGTPTGWTNAFAAIAAAVVIAIVPVGYLVAQNRAMHAAMLADGAAAARMASSTHRTVAFTGMPNADANVIYAANGSWYVIVVRGATKALHVVWMHDRQATMLGTTEMRGDVAMLYLPASHRMDQIALMDGDRLVASAKLAF